MEAPSICRVIVIGNKAIVLAPRINHDWKGISLCATNILIQHHTGQLRE
jgi:hypothetical protein